MFLDYAVRWNEGVLKSLVGKTASLALNETADNVTFKCQPPSNGCYVAAYMHTTASTSTVLIKHFLALEDEPTSRGERVSNKPS